MTQEQLNIQRHSLAHLMAASIQKLWPTARFGVGPVIENGFYYDVEIPDYKLTEADLAKIEKRMREKLKKKYDFKRQEISIDEAIDLFEKIDQPYKVELLTELKNKGTTKLNESEIEVMPEGASTISVYWTGDFIDLCRGPHVHNVVDLSEVAFKLERLSGAYWRGDEKNPMLTRIYGLAFATQKELDDYLAMLAEAKKRDHRKIGKELDLFTFSDLVGSGLPLFLPKGTVIMRELSEFARQEKIKRGYSFVTIPHIAKSELYKQSGHLGKYETMMPLMKDGDGNEFAMKAMNCPHHFEMFKAAPHSYRELPIRYAENTTVYRNEKSGELAGLLRVKALTQDDTHHFVREDQISSEIEMIFDLMASIYSVFGFSDFLVQLSVRDRLDKKKYFGSDKLWEKSEQILTAAAKKWGKPYKIEEGEAAFYGPKIDIMVKDAIGRDWQLTTIQLDFNQPENFDLLYTGEDGHKHRPAILHVAILGSLERFLGVLIEHYVGAFPLWLSPVQVKILSVGSAHEEFCLALAEKLKSENIRVETDLANETVGHKIRKAASEKIPYALVIGDKEMNSDKLAVRVRGQEKLLEIFYPEFVEKIHKSIAERSLEL